MMILHQKNLILENDVTKRKNPDLGSGIYLTDSKVAQLSRREKEEAKKETAKKTAAQKLCLQKNRSKDFQKFQDFMYSLLLSPYKQSMFVKLVSLS